MSKPVNKLKSFIRMAKRVRSMSEWRGNWLESEHCIERLHADRRRAKPIAYMPGKIFMNAKRLRIDLTGSRRNMTLGRDGAFIVTDGKTVTRFEKLSDAYRALIAGRHVSSKE